MTSPDSETPEIHILILGDSGVGKSTFISRVTQGTQAGGSVPLPILRDENQPFAFDVTTRKYGAFRLLISDTSSPTHVTLTHPSVLLLAFSVVSRPSLNSLHTSWKDLVERHFNYDESLPVLVLGLQRDLREAKHPREPLQEGKIPELASHCIHPNEAIAVAQGMRCDRYAECSAVTGELVKEAWEDIVGMAVATQTEKGGRGGRTEGASCRIM